MNDRIDYYQKFLKVVENLGDKRPRLLLHSCCAPCSSLALEVLNKYFSISILYFNPNITDRIEYELRLSEQKKFVKAAYPKLKVIEAGYDTQLFYSQIKGLEAEREGGKRCKVCFYLRLKKTAEIAKEGGFDLFATTLTVSPYKNAHLLNYTGEILSKKYGVDYLCTDLKKNDGYKRSIELSKKYGLYRQSYCGCEF